MEAKGRILIIEDEAIFSTADLRRHPLRAEVGRMAEPAGNGLIRLAAG
jgi:hypothetical protein